MYTAIVFLLLQLCQMTASSASAQTTDWKTYQQQQQQQRAKQQPATQTMPSASPASLADLQKELAGKMGNKDELLKLQKKLQQQLGMKTAANEQNTDSVMADFAEHMRKFKGNLEDPPPDSSYYKFIHTMTPYLKKLTDMMADPRVQESIESIRTRFNLKTFGFMHLILIILFFVFRSWRYGNTNSMLGRLWVEVYSLVSYMLLASLGIPLLLFGSHYWTILEVGYETFCK